MADKPFRLFDNVKRSVIGEFYEHDELGNLNLSAPANYLNYVEYTFNKNLEYTSEIGKKILTKIDREIDPDNISDKDPIKFCRDNNDYVFLIIIKSLNKYREFDSGNKYDTSLHSKRVKFLEYLKGEFLEWYRINKIQYPSYITESVENSNEVKSFEYGWLIKKIEEYAKQDNCTKNKSVKSTTIDEWIKKLRNEGYSITTNTVSSIRSTLTRLGYTKEKQ